MKAIDEVKRDLTLILLYLNSWEEQAHVPYRRSWKGYDFDDIDKLIEQEFINGKPTSKSISFYEEGIAKAKELAKEYGIEV
ncbi:hypothetical protein M2480_003168 [Parabacteroides sp. PFB2-12]|uniref:DUF6429 family protein n=1 Tax=unclassified Parabacteroides TaxID=2649774 RepID=UPI002475D742|nr:MULTISPECIES: DUF6429 family protein [unclassified Parabacteroides]MDH6344224.1 hypothetical protein [Parabacteroides sp. PM6-13]MDH6392160.1 hypothetical protein [Parabacteroides sp. PFB2-12]MDL2309804.1 DUF6429 family protein [Parabacteroides sp. OttesenSCG-928-B22]